jgi:hypothetical protein
MSIEATRKAKTPSEVSIRRAANGGYLVRHSYDNQGAGESYRPSEEHVFTSHQDLIAHVHKHTAADGPPAEAGGAAPTGVGTAPTVKAPGPNSRGAGLD